MAELRVYSNPIFMPQLPRYEPLVTDTSGIGYFKQCDLKYFFRIVLGYAPAAEPPYFTFGRAYHKFREILESRYQSTEIDKLIPDAIEAALAIHHKDPLPGSSKFDFLTKTCLVGSCKVALDHWTKEKMAKKIEVLATEQVFRLQMSDGKTKRGGRIDQLVRWMGQLWGRDFKTTSKEIKKGSKARTYYENGFDPNDQFSCYTWAESQLSGERVSGQIIEVLVNGKTFGPYIETMNTQRTPNQLKTWEQSQIQWEKKIELARATDIWAQNEKHCSFCEYHAVCKFTTEQAMISKLKSPMYQHKPYDYEAHYDE